MKARQLLAVASIVLGLVGVCFAAPVAQNHIIKGIQCEACHTQMPLADYNKCIACHGGKEKLIQSNSEHSVLKTADVPCSICHQGHQDK